MEASTSPMGNFVSSVEGNDIFANKGQARDGLYRLSTTGFFSSEGISLDERFNNDACDAKVIDFHAAAEEENESVEELGDAPKVVKISNLIDQFNALAYQPTVSLQVYSDVTGKILNSGDLNFGSALTMFEWSDLYIPCREEIVFKIASVDISE